MILISCIDDRGGLLFHGRRLSRDRVLCQDVLRTCAGSPLWMAPGSRSLFSSLRDGLSSSILTSEDFLAQAAPGEFCFLEDRPIRPFLDRVESMVLLSTGTAATPPTCFWTWTRPPWVVPVGPGGISRLLP